MAAVAWPSMRCTTLTLAPALIASDAVVCRSPLGTSPSIPASTLPCRTPAGIPRWGAIRRAAGGTPTRWGHPRHSDMLTELTFKCGPRPAPLRTVPARSRMAEGFSRSPRSVSRSRFPGTRHNRSRWLVDWRRPCAATVLNVGRCLTKQAVAYMRAGMYAGRGSVNDYRTG